MPEAATLASERTIKVEKVGKGWAVMVRPTSLDHPDHVQPTEQDALVAARLLRFGTGWPIEGHPVGKAKGGRK